MKRLLLLWVSALLLAATAVAQETCDAEVKVLLIPDVLPSVLASLHPGGSRVGVVYLYDTPGLDLLSHGMLLRLRQGASSDLTVKLRTRDASNTLNPSSNAPTKCELDVASGHTFRSLSITKKVSGTVPENGTDLLALLTRGQKRLAESVPIDWNRVKRIAEIRSTSWRLATPPHFPKVSLELWEWPGGSLLEMSARVPAANVSTAFVQLQQLAAENKLMLNPEQETKTRLALENLVNAAAR